MRLRVPEPCHEDWPAMTPTARGRHCAACAKAVVDFTRLSDRQVFAYLQQRRGEAVCGRLRDDQLGRAIKPVTAVPKLRAWRRYLAGLIVLGVTALAGRAQAQTVRGYVAAERTDQPSATTGDPIEAAGTEADPPAGPFDLTTAVVTSYAVEPMQVSETVQGGLALLPEELAEIERRRATFLRRVGRHFRNLLRGPTRSSDSAADLLSRSEPERPDVELLLFPNPSRGRATLRIPRELAVALASVYDAAGRLVHAAPLTAEVEGDEHVLALPPAAAPGVYHVELTDAAGRPVAEALPWVVQK